MGAVVLGRLTEVPRGRASLGWAILVGALALLSYAARLAGTAIRPTTSSTAGRPRSAGSSSTRSSSCSSSLLSRGLAPATLGLRRPRSWARRRRAGSRAALVAIWIVGFVLNFFLEAGEEQGLVPDGWDSSRAAPFVANFVVVALVAPFVEELTYRGLGYAAVRDAFGAIAAVVVTALAFGLAHGLVVALPVLTIFGAILAWLRYSTDSIYPPMILHAVFNGAALIAAVRRCERGRAHRASSAREVSANDARDRRARQRAPPARARDLGAQGRAGRRRLDPDRERRLRDAARRRERRPALGPRASSGS